MPLFYALFTPSIFWEIAAKCKHMLNKNAQTVTHFGMNDAPQQTSFATMPHILVVDDDDRIRDLVARYLTEHDFFVTTAQDAAEARQILDMAEYDAIVLDVMMPGQTGVEFTHELRKPDMVQYDIPVLLLTAMGEADDKIDGLTSGADDYLTKPFDPRELVLRLQAILRRRPKIAVEKLKLKIGGWFFDEDHNELVDVERDQAVNLTDRKSVV